MVAFGTHPEQTRQLTIAGATYPASSWEAARDQARHKQIKVFRGHTLEDWQTTSHSHPGQRHTVNGHCDCLGAQHGHLCMHLAAVRSAQMHAGLMRQCVACHAWDYTELMTRVESDGPYVYLCQHCAEDDQPAPKPERKPITRLEDLYQD